MKLKLAYFILAGAGLAVSLYYKDYVGAMVVTLCGFMVAQA